jgi:hypothetical protein
MPFETKIPTANVRILSDFFLFYPVGQYAHSMYIKNKRGLLFIVSL